MTTFILQLTEKQRLEIVDELNSVQYPGEYLGHIARWDEFSLEVKFAMAVAVATGISSVFAEYTKGNPSSGHFARCFLEEHGFKNFLDIYDANAAVALALCNSGLMQLGMDTWDQLPIERHEHPKGIAS